MTKTLIVLLLAAAVSRSAGAQAMGPIDGTVASGGPPSTQRDSTTLSVRGTIDAYDTSTRMLSLSTSHGRVQFPIAPTVRIRQGWHRVDSLELKKFADYHATVRYTESGGNKTVESVHVFGRNER